MVRRVKHVVAGQAFFELRQRRGSLRLLNPQLCIKTLPVKVCNQLAGKECIPSFGLRRARRRWSEAGANALPAVERRVESNCRAGFFDWRVVRSAVRPKKMGAPDGKRLSDRRKTASLRRATPRPSISFRIGAGIPLSNPDLVAR